MKPLAALLLAACASIAGTFQWRWARSPEPGVVSYRVEAHYAEAFHFLCQVWWCPSDCLAPPADCCRLIDSTCISYTSTVPFLAASEPQPAAGPEVCTDWDRGSLAGIVIPSLDSVLFVDARAVDSAGNVGN